MTTIPSRLKNDKITQWLGGVLVFVLVFFPLFTHLDSLPIRVWDEARNAINAYEMTKNGQWFVTHYDGSPDMWNTKPPLLIWLQALWIKLIGFNELAIRLPSAIAAFLTVFIFYRFLKTKLNHSILALIPTFVLLTSTGFLGEHAARNGDYDALLTLFTTAAALNFYQILQTQHVKYFYYFFGCLALGVLTKGIAGLLFLPAYFFLSLFFKQLVNILKNKHFYFGAVLFVILVLSIYIIRESENPGYLKAVYNNELGGRFLEVTENHKAGFWFYYSNFFTRFDYWIYLVPAGFLFGLFSKDETTRRLNTFGAVMALSYFFVISSAQTKLTWYDIPMYPFLALLSANFIVLIYSYFQQNDILSKHLTKNVLPAIFLFFIFIKPYENIIQNNHTSHDKDYAFYELGHFLQNKAFQFYEPGVNVIYHDEYFAHILFYIEKHRILGYDIQLKELSELNIGDVVFTSTYYWGLPKIESVFTYELLYEKGSIVKIRLLGPLNDESRNYD
jgi:4-amino-4-deoxy-L-arabinose transferase-like glycosyltransferase